MYRTIDDFLEDWHEESAGTLKLFSVLTDDALATRVDADGRSLGRLAWHVTVSVTEMLTHAGLPIASAEKEAQPGSASAIAERYRVDADLAAKALVEFWNDAMLDESVAMYGDMWKRGRVLSALIRHQAHHRGQMTVLMRQAGLAVPGLYGPAREEWAAMGMPAME